MGIVQNLYWKIRSDRWCRKFEAEYAAQLPRIADETRSYINKMQNSNAIPDLVKQLLRKGTPESFEVSQWGVSWRYKDDPQVNSIQFKHMGLPNLNAAHKFSTQIDKGVWSAYDKENRSYLNRLLESARQGGDFHKENPDLFGVASYDSTPDDESTRNRPCINECVVVGVLLCRSMGVTYTYEWSTAGAKFTKQYVQTRTW